MENWRAGVAGGISGLITRAAVAPLDVVKIRLQLQVVNRQTPSRPSALKYRGILRTMRCVVREEGILSLWKGNLTAEILWGSYMSIQFFAYNTLQGLVPRVQGEQGVERFRAERNLLCGGLAGFSGTLLTYPFDLIRTRLAAQPEPKIYSGVVDAVRTVYRVEGPVGFFRGLSPSLLQVVPYMGIQFAVYEALSRRARELRQSILAQSTTQGNTLDHLFSGCCAGIAGKVATLPMDVAKKRMQVYHAPLEVWSKLQTGGIRVEGGGGLLQVWQGIWSREGLAGFFRGGAPSILKTGISSALSFTVFELAMDFMGVDRQEY